MQRERLRNRLGFILLSAGCAIGIGNVWKFPYITGQNGGGIFVLIYLFFLLVMGIPVMTMEFSLGRASRKSPVKLYQMLEPKGTKWHIHGYLALIAQYLLMMFYTAVAGWMVKYCVSMGTGIFTGLDSEGIAAVFGGVLSNPGEMILYTYIVIAIGFFVASFGLQNGIERVTKYMMIALLLIMIALAVNSFFMEGGRAGLEFYLLPSVENLKSVGVGKVIVSAMNQAFFTLSLGIGAMAIFGSYIGKERTLLGESINVAALDTLVAIVSGLIIFPACSAHNLEVDSGPNLIFITLPNLFRDLPLGRLWGSLFFIFLSFAALSTVFAVFESIIACTCDIFKCSRKKACLCNFLIMLVMALPCVLGFNVLSGFQPMGDGSTIMDIEDFLVSNILLPLGSLCYVLFCTSKHGWGWDNFVNEANIGKGVKVRKWMYGYMKFILPIMILIVFAFGMIDTIPKFF